MPFRNQDFVKAIETYAELYKVCKGFNYKCNDFEKQERLLEIAREKNYILSNIKKQYQEPVVRLAWTLQKRSSDAIKEFLGEAYTKLTLRLGSKHNHTIYSFLRPKHIGIVGKLEWIKAIKVLLSGLDNKSENEILTSINNVTDRRYIINDKRVDCNLIKSDFTVKLSRRMIAEEDLHKVGTQSLMPNLLDNKSPSPPLLITSPQSVSSSRSGFSEVFRDRGRSTGGKPEEKHNILL